MGVSAFFSLSISPSCGVYSFRGVVFPENVETVTVLPVESEVSTFPPALADELTERIQDQFVYFSRIQPVAQHGDLTISCVVREYSFTPVAPQGTTALFTRIRMVVEVRYECHVCDTLQEWTRTFHRYTEVQGNILIEDATGQPEIQELIQQIASDVFQGAGTTW